MIEMRELRNSIVHEYIPDVIKNIFISALKLTPLLIKDVELINSYCTDKFIEEKDLWNYSAHTLLYPDTPIPHYTREIE